MLNNNFTTSSAALLSGSRTGSAHETSSVNHFTGNPYEDLSSMGITLHGCQLRYLKKPNANGHTVTGRFNLSGREETAGANSYQDLIIYVVRRHEEHRAYVAECRLAKQQLHKMLGA